MQLTSVYRIHTHTIIMSSYILITLSLLQHLQCVFNKTVKKRNIKKIYKSMEEKKTMVKIIFCGDTQISYSKLDV